jgi:glycosyltransferase involved in cell wall biosynthesis
VSTTIAVVIPAYNCADTLDHALRSVAGQTLPPREVVVIDDGSTDGTVAIARSWSDRLPLEVVALGVNGGPGNARNEGVGRTSAPMLAFMDADDVWLTDHLEVCDAVQRRTGGVAIARSMRVYPDGHVEPGRGDDPPATRQLDWIVRGNALGMHALMRRATFDGVGGFDHAVEGAEDWDLWVRIVRAGTSLHRTTQCTYLKRQHADNLSKRTEFIAEASVRMLDRLDESLSDQERRELRRALRETRADIALFRAYGRVKADDYRGARAHALRSLTGRPAVALRGAVLATAPGAWKHVAALRHFVEGQLLAESSPSKRPRSGLL